MQNKPPIINTFKGMYAEEHGLRHKPAQHYLCGSKKFPNFVAFFVVDDFGNLHRLTLNQYRAVRYCVRGKL